MSLKTYAGSDLNKLSPTLQEYLDGRKLKVGDIVKYRLLVGTKNLDPKRKKGDDWLFPSSIDIPLRATILDPETSKTVDIGVVNTFNDKTKLPDFRHFIVNPQTGDGGIFMLKGSVVADMDVYEALELSNRNKSNPYRDTSEEVVFERVDDVQESKVRSTRRNFLFESHSAIRRWNADELRAMGAAYNLSPSLDPGILKDRLEEIAEKDPETFYKTIDNPDTATKAIIKMSTEAGIISFNAHENKWSFVGSDETLALLDRREGVSETEQLAEFLKNSANGPAIQGKLEKILRANKEKSKP
jgi:hypothetical protein